MPASFNLGVWRQATLSHGVLYRWEGDQGQSGSGFVILDADQETIRPSDADGGALGDLVVDAATMTVSGAAADVDQGTFLQVVAALVRARARSGDVPETAHAYYG